jgi:hypothetical protein
MAVGLGVGVAGTTTSVGVGVGVDVDVAVAVGLGVEVAVGVGAMIWKASDSACCVPSGLITWTDQTPGSAPPMSKMHRALEPPG